MFDGKRLWEMKTSRDMTQQQLGDLVHLCRSAVAKYETGVSIPSADAILIFAEYFGVTTDYLLGVSGSDDKKPDKPVKVWRRVII